MHEDICGKLIEIWGLQTWGMTLQAEVQFFWFAMNPYETLQFD